MDIPPCGQQHPLFRGQPRVVNHGTLLVSGPEQVAVVRTFRKPFPVGRPFRLRHQQQRQFQHSRRFKHRFPLRPPGHDGVVQRTVRLDVLHPSAHATAQRVQRTHLKQHLVPQLQWGGVLCRTAKTFPVDERRVGTNAGPRTSRQRHRVGQRSGCTCRTVCTIGSSGNGVHRETQKRRENKAWLQMSTTRNIVQTLVGVGR